MNHIPLRDILINARQESFRMRHFYLGVEHLFIALLAIQGGLATSILEDAGLTADYVIDAIRRKSGKGGKNRLWAGLPNTPRADVVLSIANDLALEGGRTEIDERDLLTAILEEGDSIPVRVLMLLGLDRAELIAAARERSVVSFASHSYVGIVFGTHYAPQQEITDEYLFILRRMFHGYSQVRIESRLTGGYTRALVLVVTPLHADGREDSPVVVKIDRADHILDEARRYDQHVKATLPPLTARLEEKPTAPETSDLAGLRYTFIAPADGGAPKDLRAVVHEWGAARLGDWLQRSLYPSFGRTWWAQRRAYRFQIWSEYDWMLPPILTLELVDGDDAPPNTPVIKEPVRRSRIRELEYGDKVIVENFTVQQVKHERKAIRLAIGRGEDAARRAYRIEVRGLDLNLNTYYRGEIIERLVGRVYQTRTEVLVLALGALRPDFEPRAEVIPGIPDWQGLERLPNPILLHEPLMERYVNGALSRIHGDLHLGNVLVGPNNSPFLIDFEHTREGHTLIDWATLEISLLADVVLPPIGGDWDAARTVIIGLLRVLQGGIVEDSTLQANLSAVAAVRAIAGELLATPDAWIEYHIALLFCGLRAMMWETMSLGGRRVAFLVAALSTAEIRRRSNRPTGSADTAPDDDLTDSGEQRER